MRRLAFFGFVLLLLLPLRAGLFFTSSSFKTPATGSDDNRAGSSTWVNPTNIQAVDGVFATNTLAGGDALTHYLKGVNYFTSADVPAGATINGLEMRMTRKVLNATAANDSSILSIKAGTPGGTDKSAGAAWPTSNTAITYGTTADLWGQTWTQANVIAATFGFEIQVDGVLASTASVDSFECRCTYTPAAVGTTTGSMPMTGVGRRAMRTTGWKRARFVGVG